MDSSLYKEIFDDFLPCFRKLAGTEKYSIALSGSHGKGIADKDSDFDFMLYYEKPAERSVRKEAYKEMEKFMSKWKAKGVVVDGVWPRTYDEVDAEIEAWLSGNGKLEQYVWTIWGFNYLTGIYNQMVIEDTCGKIDEWKELLSKYPSELKTSILNKHVPSLEYWRQDYHYANKVQRKDIVFVASLSARLVHDMMQVIYALNECYYPGDGANLKYTEKFAIKPLNFEARITELLQLNASNDGFETHYKLMIQLIDEVLQLL